MQLLVMWFTDTGADDVGAGVYWWTRQGVVVVELCTSLYTLVRVTPFNLPG